MLTLHKSNQLYWTVESKKFRLSEVGDLQLIVFNEKVISGVLAS
jgi:hypothetical protein